MSINESLSDDEEVLAQILKQFGETERQKLAEILVGKFALTNSTKPFVSQFTLILNRQLTEIEIYRIDYLESIYHFPNGRSAEA